MPPGSPPPARREERVLCSGPGSGRNQGVQRLPPPAPSGGGGGERPARGRGR